MVQKILFPEGHMRPLAKLNYTCARKRFLFPIFFEFKLRNIVFFFLGNEFI